MLNPILAAQLADDYCCTVEDVLSPAPVFSVLKFCQLHLMHFYYIIFLTKIKDVSMCPWQ